MSTVSAEHLSSQNNFPQKFCCLLLIDILCPGATEKGRDIAVAGRRPHVQVEFLSSFSHFDDQRSYF